MTDEQNLAAKKCVPCEGGAEPLEEDAAIALLEQIPEWRLGADAKSIHRKFEFKNFAEALAFANKVGEIAEAEGHHPDLHVSWGKVGIDLSTHAIGGLSENDFIVASKVDRISQ